MAAVSGVASVLVFAAVALVVGAAATWPGWLWRWAATLPGLEFEEGELERPEDWPQIASPQ